MMDAAFKAMADPTRRTILRMLRERGMTAGEISSAFGISGPSMSHHFNVLKAADLIVGRRDGQQIIYTLNTTVVEDLLAVFLDVVADRAPTGAHE